MDRLGPRVFADPRGQWDPLGRLEPRERRVFRGSKGPLVFVDPLVLDQLEPQVLLLELLFNHSRPTTFLLELKHFTTRQQTLDLWLDQGFVQLLIQHTLTIGLKASLKKFLVCLCESIVTNHKVLAILLIGKLV